MSKYGKDVRKQALEMMDSVGVKKTSETMHIAKLTLYRWQKEAIPGIDVELDNAPKTIISSVKSKKEITSDPVNEVCPITAAPILDEPTILPVHKDAAETAKHLLFDETNEKAAHIRSLETENARLWSEVEQLRSKCERYRDALVALIR